MANNKRTIYFGLDYSQFSGGVTEINRKMGLLDAEFKLATQQAKNYGNETDQLGTVVGLAKRMEEVIRVGDPYPLFLDRNSQAFRIMTHIRDEAHRFGITFHRSLRSKQQTHSALREIKGVGEQTEQRLLIHFGSVARIAAAPVEDLAGLVGPSLARRIKEALNENGR